MKNYMKITYYTPSSFIYLFSFAIHGSCAILAITLSIVLLAPVSVEVRARLNAPTMGASFTFNIGVSQ